MTHTNGTCKTYIIKEESIPDAQSELNEEKAIELARQCLATVHCDDCDLCVYFCPDLCISRDEASSSIKIDYDYCKGCGICAYICPKNAIQMIRE